MLLLLLSVKLPPQSLSVCHSSFMLLQGDRISSLYIYMVGFFFFILAIALSMSRASRPGTFDSHCLTHATNYVANYF